MSLPQKYLTGRVHALDTSHYKSSYFWWISWCHHVAKTEEAYCSLANVLGYDTAVNPSLKNSRSLHISNAQSLGNPFGKKVIFTVALTWSSMRLSALEPVCFRGFAHSFQYFLKSRPWTRIILWLQQEEEVSIMVWLSPREQEFSMSVVSFSPPSKLFSKSELSDSDARVLSYEPRVPSNEWLFEVVYCPLWLYVPRYRKS